MKLHEIQELHEKALQHVINIGFSQQEADEAVDICARADDLAHSNLYWLASATRSEIEEMFVRNSEA